MQTNLLARVSRLLFLVAALPLLSPLLGSAGGLVWSDRPSGTKAIRAGNFDGSNVRNLYSSAGDPRGVIVDAAAERVYFCDRFSGSTSGEINSVPLAGGVREQHVTGLNRPADLRFDAAARTLYWCEENAGLIRSAPLPLAGGTLTPQTLFSGVPSPYYLDIDPAGAKLYWGSSASSLTSGPLAGGTPDAPLYNAGLNMRGVAVDAAAGMIYWTERDARVIRRRAIAGGPVEDLYTGLDTPHGLVLDLAARKLYWVDTGTGGVGGFNARGVSRGEMDGASAGAAEVIVPGAAINQPWDLDLDPRTGNYTEWVARFFRFDAPAANKLAAADPDGDGASNLAEYAFGTSPVLASSVPRIEWVKTLVDGGEYPGIRFLRRAQTGGLDYRIQMTLDFVTWFENDTIPTTTEVSVSVPDTEGMETVTVRSLDAIDDAPRQLFRVKVE